MIFIFFVLCVLSFPSWGTPVSFYIRYFRSSANISPLFPQLLLPVCPNTLGSLVQQEGALRPTSDSSSDRSGTASAFIFSQDGFLSCDLSVSDLTSELSFCWLKGCYSVEGSTTLMDLNEERLQVQPLLSATHISVVCPFYILCNITILYSKNIIELQNSYATSSSSGSQSGKCGYI